MKNKYGRAAALAGIATVLVLAFGVVINSTLFRYMGGVVIARFLIIAVESVAAFFLAIKFGSKALLKKDVLTSNILPLSLAAGLVKTIFFFVVPIYIELIADIIIFAIYFVFALIIDKKIEGTNQSENDEALKNPVQQKPRVTANEAMSAQAQYAFNEKLAQMKETATIIDEVAEAKIFAQAVELQLLKAPSTAQFCSLEEMTVTPTINGEALVVSGYVDSQNSYGAIIRTPFKITVFKENGVWKNADRFVNTASVIEGKIISNTVIWWILGIIGSVISFLVYYFTVLSSF